MSKSVFKINCDNCGAPITTWLGFGYKCEYCGTTYFVDHSQGDEILYAWDEPIVCTTLVDPQYVVPMPRRKKRL